MKFDLNCYKNRPRDKAALVSSTLNLDTDVCLSFWVLMYTNVASQTRVGALRVSQEAGPWNPSPFYFVKSGSLYTNSLCTAFSHRMRPSLKAKEGFILLIYFPSFFFPRVCLLKRMYIRTHNRVSVAIDIWQLSQQR